MAGAVQGNRFVLLSRLSPCPFLLLFLLLLLLLLFLLLLLSEGSTLSRCKLVTRRSDKVFDLTWDWGFVCLLAVFINHWVGVQTRF